MRCGFAIDIRKHELEYKKKQQGRKQTPTDSQCGTLIFGFKIPLDQFLEQEAVLHQFLEHR